MSDERMLTFKCTGIRNVSLAFKLIQISALSTFF